MYCNGFHFKHRWKWISLIIWFWNKVQLQVFHLFWYPLTGSLGIFQGNRNLWKYSSWVLSIGTSIQCSLSLATAVTWFQSQLFCNSDVLFLVQLPSHLYCNYTDFFWLMKIFCYIFYLSKYIHLMKSLMINIVDAWWKQSVNSGHCWLPEQRKSLRMHAVSNL